LVSADLLEQGPLRFDVCEVLLALIFFLPWFQQTMFAPDALHGHVAQRKIELTLEARRAEGGQLLTESQDLLLDRGFQGLFSFLPERPCC